jgi:hypothetical protein
MQSSIAKELRHRLELYQRVFDFCRTGHFSFARFVALAPDRLRLSIGDAPNAIRVPIAVEPSFATALKDALAPPQLTLTTTSDRELLRQTIRLAQLDPELDPFAVRAMLERQTPVFLERAARVHEKIFSEIGHGEGGEETAYLLHLASIEALARPVRERTLDHPALAATLVDLSLKTWLAHEDESDRAKLSLRLGLKCATLLSPLVFAPAGTDFARNALSVYRTTPEATLLARRVILEPIETIDLERVLSTLTERLYLDEAAPRIVARDTLLELLRDALLAVVLQDARAAKIPAIADATRSLKSLKFAAQNTRIRKELAGALEPFASTKAATAATWLLGVAEQTLTGDLSPLGLHGDLKERAKIAVLGAVVYVLDEYAEKQRRALLGHLEPVSADAISELAASGRCYRISEDEQPLYRLPPGEREALMLIDARPLVARICTLGQRAPGETLARMLHRPLLDRAERLRGVSVVYAAAESLLLCGDLLSMIELGTYLARIAAQTLELSAQLTIATDVEEVEIGDGRSIVVSPPIQGTGGISISRDALTAFRRARGHVLVFEDHIEGGRRTLTAYTRGSRETRALFLFRGDDWIIRPVE